MRIRFSHGKPPVIAIAGHAGSGHCHSHNQFLQDDSAGLAVALSLFQEAAGISLVVKEVRAVPGLSGSITVETVSGGVGFCSPRRGVSTHEARLAKSIEGRCAIRTQTLAMEVFGRVYGQGAAETTAALQTALANAAVDSFVKNFPSVFIYGEENIPGNCGKIAGAVLDYMGIPIAVLATVNAAADGSGPVEDLEGNVAAGVKKIIMRKLGMLETPTIIVEGKVYSPAYSDAASEPYFLVRADPDDDNIVVAQAISRAAERQGFAVKLRDDVMKRVPGALENATKSLGDAIVKAGLELKEARCAQKKTAILANLAQMVSEDGAGISFMSDRLHEIVGGTGAMPGTAAVLSRIVPKTYRDANVVPFLTESDVALYLSLIKAAVPELRDVLPEAVDRLRKRACQKNLDAFITLS